MLDELFQKMMVDEYSRWNIHTCIKSSAGNINITVPHELADAGYFLKKVILPLHGFSRPMSETNSKPKWEELLLKENDKRTRFQSVLSRILDLIYKDSENLLIGIPVSLKDVTDFPKGTRNLIGIPVLHSAICNRLLTSDSNNWRSELTELAKIENNNLAQLQQRIAPLKTSRRKPLYQKLAVNQADIIVSYWGALERHLPGFTEEELLAFDFSVTANVGPKSICVIWSIGKKTFARITSADKSAWEGKLLLFEVRHEK